MTYRIVRAIGFHERRLEREGLPDYPIARRACEKLQDDERAAKPNETSWTLDIFCVEREDRPFVATNKPRKTKTLKANQRPTAKVCRQVAFNFTGR